MSRQQQEDDAKPPMEEVHDVGEPSETSEDESDEVYSSDSDTY